MATIFSETLPSGDTLHIDTELHHDCGERDIVEYHVMFNNIPFHHSIIGHLLLAMAHVVDTGSPISPFYQKPPAENNDGKLEKVGKMSEELDAKGEAVAKAKLEAETDEWLDTLWGPSEPSPLGTKPPPFEDVEE
jgi:hypothetical protein